MKNKAQPVIFDDEDPMERCRRVREELSKRFKTVEEMLRYAEDLDRKHGVGKRGRAAARSAKRTQRARMRAATHKATTVRSGG